MHILLFILIYLWMTSKTMDNVNVMETVLGYVRTCQLVVDLCEQQCVPWSLAQVLLCDVYTRKKWPVMYFSNVFLYLRHDKKKYVCVLSTVTYFPRIFAVCIESAGTGTVNQMAGYNVLISSNMGIFELTAKR